MCACGRSPHSRWQPLRQIYAPEFIYSSIGKRRAHRHRLAFQWESKRKFCHNIGWSLRTQQQFLRKSQEHGKLLNEIKSTGRWNFARGERAHRILSQRTSVIRKMWTAVQFNELQDALLGTIQLWQVVFIRLLCATETPVIRVGAKLEYCFQ